MPGFCGRPQERGFIFPIWAVNLQLFETQSCEKQRATRKHSYRGEGIKTDRVSLALFKHLDPTVPEASHLSKLCDHKSRQIYFVGKASLRFNSLATKRIESNAKRDQVQHRLKAAYFYDFFSAVAPSRLTECCLKVLLSIFHNQVLN